jgi:hypothetical protein
VIDKRIKSPQWKEEGDIVIRKERKKVERLAHVYLGGTPISSYTSRF